MKGAVLILASFAAVLMAVPARGAHRVVFRGGVTAPMDDFRLGAEKLVIQRDGKSWVVPRSELRSLQFEKQMPSSLSEGNLTELIRLKGVAPLRSTLPRGVELLLREDSWELRSDGSHVERHRRIMRIHDARGLARGEQSLLADPRETQLRLLSVLTLKADGSTVGLDPACVSREMPWLGHGPASSWLRLRFSLPGLEVGSISEWSWEKVHRRNVPWNPFQGQVDFEGRDPVRLARVELSVPEGVALKTAMKACGRGTRPLVLRAEGRILHRWESRDLAVLDGTRGCPPRLVFSAGQSWDELASWMRKRLAEASPASGPLPFEGESGMTPTPWLAELHPRAESPQAIESSALTWCLREGARLRRAGRDVELLLLSRKGASGFDGSVPSLLLFDDCLLRSRDGRDHWIPGAELQGGGLPAPFKGRNAWSPGSSGPGSTMTLDLARRDRDRVELELEGSFHGDGTFEAKILCRVKGLFVDAVMEARREGDEPLERESADRLRLRCPEARLESLEWRREGRDLLAVARISVDSLTESSDGGRRLLPLEACRFLPSPLHRLDGRGTPCRGSIELDRHMRIRLPEGYDASLRGSASRRMSFATWTSEQRQHATCLELSETWQVEGDGQSLPLAMLRRGFLARLAEETAQPLLLQRKG